MPLAVPLLIWSDRPHAKCNGVASCHFRIGVAKSHAMCIDVGPPRSQHVVTGHFQFAGLLGRVTVKMKWQVVCNVRRCWVVPLSKKSGRPRSTCRCTGPCNFQNWGGGPLSKCCGVWGGCRVRNCVAGHCQCAELLGRATFTIESQATLKVQR